MGRNVNRRDAYNTDDTNYFKAISLKSEDIVTSNRKKRFKFRGAVPHLKLLFMIPLAW